MKQNTSLVDDGGGGGLDSLASSSSSSCMTTTTDTQRIIEKIVLTKTSTASATTGESINHNLRLSHNSIYSKMFQYALQPTQIIPHFLRMKAQPAQSDITITTMITMERLPVLVKLVRKYQGPVSVTLHINSESSDKLQLLERLIQVYMSDEYVSQFLDVHLVLDKYDRQFNMWRNIARMFAATEYVMNMDVDFYLCTDLRSNIRKLQPKYKKLLESGKAVFVVPAFEFNRNAVELEADSYPKDKHSLLKYIRSGELSMFHSKWKRGHGPTDYSRWESSEEPYRITQYNYNYEPYVLMRRDGAPWCDERFVGYGSNKAACLYEIYLAGFEFWTLPNDFLVHQRHPYPENDRRMEVIKAELFKTFMFLEKI
jgi:glycosyltransferase-like protein LARGE